MEKRNGSGGTKRKKRDCSLVEPRGFLNPSSGESIMVPWLSPGGTWDGTVSLCGRSKCSGAYSRSRYDGRLDELCFVLRQRSLVSQRYYEYD